MSTSNLYVQFGCGLCAPEGWENFDSSPRLKFERLPAMKSLTGILGARLFPVAVRYGNIVKGLSVADNSATGIYASHVLEHLGRDEVPLALANTLRMLKSGGTFRMIVPDIEWRARRYVKSLTESRSETADEFIKSCHIGHYGRPKNVMSLLRSAFGNSGHMWMYDWNTMSKLLTEAGFVSVRRCEFNDSLDSQFKKVEDVGRFKDGSNNELAIEARKA